MFKYEEPGKVRVFANVYLLNGFDINVTPLKLQEDEVSEVLFWSKEYIEEQIKLEEEMSLVKPSSAVIYQDLLKDGHI